MGSRRAECADCCSANGRTIAAPLILAPNDAIPCPQARKSVAHMGLTSKSRYLPFRASRAHEASRPVSSAVPGVHGRAVAGPASSLVLGESPRLPRPLPGPDDAAVPGSGARSGWHGFCWAPGRRSARARPLPLFRAVRTRWSRNRSVPSAASRCLHPAHRAQGLNSLRDARLRRRLRSRRLAARR